MFILKHKDIEAATIDFGNDIAEPVLKEIINEDHLPLSIQGNRENIVPWWQKRAAPRMRRDIEELIPLFKCHDRFELLLCNLALSMTDCWWLAPAGKDISWKDVSFHLNPFADCTPEILKLEKMAADGHHPKRLSPSPSLTGALEKKWIRKNGVIHLVKGNMPGISYQQSINEVFASLIHKRQSFGNYVPYNLVNLKKGRKACISKCFTSEQAEYIPAWEIFEKYGYNKEASFIQQYLDRTEQEGLNRNVHGSFINYMFLADFVITNIDRHLGNFGILRNPDTLEITAPAPIFDNGNSMFYSNLAEVDTYDLLNTKIKSLYSTEQKMMEKLTDLDALDISKLPSPEETIAIYSEDAVLTPLLDRLKEAYGTKLRMLEMLQSGMSFDQMKQKISSEISF